MSLAEVWSEESLVTTAANAAELIRVWPDPTSLPEPTPRLPVELSSEDADADHDISTAVEDYARTNWKVIHPQLLSHMQIFSST